MSAAGWGPSPGDQPLPPQNGSVQSPFISGVLDLNWDNPSLLAKNAAYTVVGVNIYRSDVSDRGPFYRINEFPIGGTFYRDWTQNTQVTETVAWSDWTYKGNGPNTQQYSFSTKQTPAVKQVPEPPYDRPTPANMPTDVTLTIDDVEVPVHSMFGPTGEIVLIDQGTFNVATEKIEPALLPTEDSVVEVSYWVNKNHLRSSLDTSLFYRLTTVVIDTDTPSGYKETELEWCKPILSSAVEDMDYIWREAVRRNAWILQQGGERVKIFIRKTTGIPCNCGLDPKTKEYLGQHSQRCEVCFPPGVEVTLSDYTRKPIEGIRIGDSVITHKGRTQVVTETMVRQVTEDLVDIRATHGVGFSSTCNHPVRVVRQKDARCQRAKSSSICTGPGSKKICTRKPWKIACSYDVQVKAQWVRADDVQQGDYLVFVVPYENSSFIMERDRLRVLGYYAAEGWTAKKRYRNGSVSISDKSTCFGFHVKEKETFVKELQSCIRSVYDASSSVQKCSNSDNGCAVAISKQSVAEDMLKHVGKYSKHKCLSKDLVRQDSQSSKEFLGAYFNGDGWQCLNKSRTHLGVGTASYNMARQVEVMLLRLGAVPRFSVRHRSGIPNPGRPGVHDTTEHSVALRKTDMHVLADTMQMEDVKSVVRKAGLAVSVGSLVLYPIRSIGLKHYEGEVYNLEVRGDHSYVANGAVVHNCYGTGFVGGYEGPYSGIIAPDDFERRISQGPTGRHKEHSGEVFMGPSPVVTQRDLIVKQTNERYSIAPSRRPTNRGNMLQQHFNITYLDEQDIRYKVPLDGVADFIRPQTRYGFRQYPSMPVDGELSFPESTMPDQAAYPEGPDAQTPMQTDKQPWAEGTQQRGRTPVYDSITK